MLANQIKLVRRLSYFKRRGAFDTTDLGKKIRFFTKNLKRKIDARYLTISKSFFKVTLFVHKGFIYKKTHISPLFVGRKLGEFSMTRKPFKYPIKKKKKKFYTKITWVKLAILF